MQKIVINVDYGGYGLSVAAQEIVGPNWRDVPRDDPALVATVESLGKASWGNYANLAVVEIPDDVLWHIAEYDGLEHVAENHRTWRA